MLCYEVLEEPMYRAAGRLVEVPGGFIGEKEGRLSDERPGEGDALLLPARQLAWAM